MSSNKPLLEQILIIMYHTASLGRQDIKRSVSKRPVGDKWLIDRGDGSILIPDMPRQDSSWTEFSVPVIYNDGQIRGSVRKYLYEKYYQQNFTLTLNFNYQSPGVETLWDLTSRRLISYWNECLLCSVRVWYICTCYVSISRNTPALTQFDEPRAVRQSPFRWFMCLAWASCQIRKLKLRDAHAPGIPGMYSPPPRVSDPKCITARASRTWRDACWGR